MQYVDSEIGSTSSITLSHPQRGTTAISGHESGQSIHLSAKSPARHSMELALFAWPVLNYFDLECLFLRVFRLHSQFARHLAGRIRAHWYDDFYSRFPEHRDIENPSLSRHMKHRRLMLCIRHSYNTNGYGPFKIYKSRYKYTCRCGDKHHIWFA